MVRPSVPDPPHISAKLWQGFGGTVGWDVGANCGQTILEMAFDFGHVIAFEPSPDSFAAAQAVVAQHGLHAEVHNLALSDHDGEVELAYPAQEQKETGQLVTVGLKGMEWEPADWGSTEKLTVKCAKADSLSLRFAELPNFVKVDTEGHEVHVLRGASEILAFGGTDFLIEFHSPENHRACMGILTEAEYIPETVRHPYYAPESRMWFQHGWIKAFAPRGKRAR